VAFRVADPGVEEVAGGEPAELVVENALRKARAVDGSWVLGADTTVVVDGRALGKPRDREEAEEFLTLLSGCWHEVWGGIALRSGDSERTSRALTRVRFRPLGRGELDWYLASGEWRERAGAYAIQGRGAALVAEVRGDFLNVVGLPVAELLRLAPELAGHRR
jgi:septum formation protein